MSLLAAAFLVIFGPGARPARAEPLETEYLEVDTLSDQEAAAIVAEPDDLSTAAKDIRLRQQALELLGLGSDDSRRRRAAGKWGFQFVFVPKEGRESVLSEYNRDLPMVPASTMKLFTGWYGFETHLRTVEYLSSMLHRSDNPMADALFRAGGGGASLRRFLASPPPHGPGLVLQGFKADDGSGLKKSDRATPRLEVSLLKAILKSPDYPVFRECLAQPDEPSTLDGKRNKRLQEFAGTLFAKTGTLGSWQPNGRREKRRRRMRFLTIRHRVNGVDALAGYVESKSGTLVFSIIGNAIPVSALAGNSAIDAVVRLHANFIADREIPRLALPQEPRLGGQPLAAPRF